MPGPSQQAGGMPGCVGLLIASDLQRTLGSVTPSRTTGQATEAHSHTTFVALSPSGRPLLTATDTRALRMLRHRRRSRSPVRMRSSAWRRSPRSSDWIAGFPTTLSAGNSGRMHSGTVDLMLPSSAPQQSAQGDRPIRHVLIALPPETVGADAGGLTHPVAPTRGRCGVPFGRMLRLSK